MTKVLITGAGLVGAHVARLEVEAGRTPVLFDLAPRPDLVGRIVDVDKCTIVRGDLLDPLDLLRAVRANDVSRIVHTAAYPGLTIGGIEAPLASVRVNVLGTATVLEVARQLELERVVACSSAAMYAQLAGGQDAGAINREEAQPRTTTIYATTKQAAENLCMNYASTFDLDAVVVRFAAVFGPPAGGGIGSYAMEQAVRAAMTRKSVELQPARSEWLYVKDAARGAHLACWATDLTDRVFNIGSDENYNGAELASAFRDVFPEFEATVAQATVQFGVDGPPMDLTRAKTQLGYQVNYPMPIAIADFRDWIVSDESRAVA